MIKLIKLLEEVGIKYEINTIKSQGLYFKKEYAKVIRFEIMASDPGIGRIKREVNKRKLHIDSRFIYSGNTSTYIYIVSNKTDFEKVHETCEKEIEMSDRFFEILSEEGKEAANKFFNENAKWKN